MPSITFVPSKDALLLAWSANFSAKLTAGPIPLGMTAAQATQYQSAHSAFATALTAATNPDTRTKTTINAKDAAKLVLTGLARGFGKMIQANPAVTDATKIGMGISVRSRPQPIPAPSAAPVVEVISVSGWTVKIGLKTSSADSKRRKPAGVTGATVMSYVGPTPTADMSKWKFEGMTGKTVTDIIFPITVPPGSQVWLTAFWFNNRKQTGPAAQPIGTNLQGGTVSMAA